MIVNTIVETGSLGAVYYNAGVEVGVFKPAGRLLLLFVGLAITCAALAAHAEDVATVDDNPALTLRLETRLRYVYIDQRDKPDRVDVTTARAIIGADLLLSPRLKVALELIHSDFVPPKRYNDDPAAFTSPYPLLPDPRHTGVNEAHVTWTPTPDWLMRLGRQRMVIGNERHLGDDSFRQVPQLYDGLSVRGSPTSGAQLTFGQFNRLRTRFGPTEPLQLTVLELAANPLPDMGVSAYALRHRRPRADSDLSYYGVAELANWVVGAALDGSHPLGELRGYYTLNAAEQRSTGDQSILHAHYWRAGAGIGWHGLIARVDHEVKGSNGGRYGFQTPLTNQYAFNGNALTFFDTPTTGLRDTWATLRWEQGRWSALGEYHWFRSDHGGLRYGREFDANVTYTINPRAYLRAQWARYRVFAGGFGADIDKVWLTVGYEIK